MKAPHRSVGVLLLATLFLTACGAGEQEEALPTPDNPGGVLTSGAEDESRYHGAELTTPYTMPDVTLTATNDEPFNLVTDTGHEVTLFTSQPDGLPEREALDGVDVVRRGSELTTRQREVLQLLAEGHSVKEIAGLLKVSPRTVEFHKAQIMDQLNLHTTVELVKYAIAQGLTGHS